MKHGTPILAVLVLAVGFVVGAWFAGDEQAWRCDDGRWVRHGNPDIPMPTTPCGASASPQLQRTVSLYYYDAERDRDAAGNIRCSARGLVAVTRHLPLTTTPIQDAVRLLLAGALTDAERARGVSTEFPLPGVSLVAASLRDGVLTLSFADPQNRTGGGSCRVGILWAQIERTALQFDGVRDVRFAPDSLFQP